MAVLWLICACGIVVWLQGVLLGKRALKRLHYARSFSTEACYAGDGIELVETIANEKVVPVPWLRLEAMLPSSLTFARSKETAISEGTIYQNHASLFTLPPRTRITRTHKVRCNGRGVFPLPSVTMTASDLFGQFISTRKMMLNKRLVVYPGLLADEEMPVSWKTWQGELAVRRWIVEDPFLVTGIREYSAGDALNRIHWKATARTGALQVQQSGYTADPHAMICLNVEDSEQMWSVVNHREVIEFALSCAATCASSLIHQGMAAGFGHNAYSSIEGEEGRRLLPEAGRPHLQTLLEAMAAVELKSLMPFHEFLNEEAAREEGRSLDYLLVTVHVSEAIRAAAAKLEARGHRVTIAEAPLRKEAGA